MSIYFKEKLDTKISLTEYLSKVELEYKTLEKELEKYKNKISYDLQTKKEKITLKYAQIKHIYEVLGDIEISKEMIETICKSFYPSKCRYGTICLKKDSIKTLYEISELFPELSEEAILSISKEYIKDLFDNYSLIEKLSIMIRKHGQQDSTFESFIQIVRELADIEEIKYEDEAKDIGFYYGQYSYKFITYFQKFIKQHHITCRKFGESLPDVELFFKDEIHLKEIVSHTRECLDYCIPISYQMYEDYLDGETELLKFPEQPAYYISISGTKIPTTFTKEEFLNKISQKQKIFKKK